MGLRTKGGVFLGGILVVSGMLLVSCKRDHLTITSMITPDEDTTNLCRSYGFNLDLDSAAALSPGHPPRKIEVCLCDTVNLYIHNIPAGFTFHNWTIIIHNQVDTIFDTDIYNITESTIASGSFDNSPGSPIPLEIEIDFQPCN